MSLRLLNPYMREFLADPLLDHRFDEAFEMSGVPRPSWQAFFDSAASSPRVLSHIAEVIRQRICDNGVTYNVYADPKGTDRPWSLDALPLILSEREWAALSVGIAQRAKLLNALLIDLYYDQHVLREGLLPTDLVFGHNNFLWPCQGVRVKSDIMLHFYAADLGRAPDGRWWVIADRTQAPSGAGYALENRTVIARAHANWFRHLNVQALTEFVRAVQSTLSSLASDGADAPFIVLLTPGPYNETYFEHAYLARQFGFPLVEGNDLTVRNDILFLRTINGLRRVHGVFRRLDDDFCDPLELRSDSALGVPGLLNAVRAGKVVIANALGSGVMESSALAGFLPGICQRLLGEPLMLPSVASWWCGEPAALQYVTENLDSLVIKPAYPNQRFEPVFGKDLDAAGKRNLLQRISAHPRAYVGQEWVRLSQAPVWEASEDGGRFAGRRVGLRTFAAATADGYCVMPGGLTRVSPQTEVEVVSMQRGGGSKDTWVMSQKPSFAVTESRYRVRVSDLKRSGPTMASREVENLYWLGRYTERVDASARLLRVALSRSLDASSSRADSCASVAFALCESMGLAAFDHNDSTLRKHLLHQSVLDANSVTGLLVNLRRLVGAAAPVRGRLSTENWRAILDLHQILERIPQAIDANDLVNEMDHLILGLSSMAGFVMDDMTRDHGWRFLVTGRRLERLQFMCIALARFLTLPEASYQGGLEALLEFADSTITYRSRYLNAVELLPVVDLLIFDVSNPHSVIFQSRLVGRYTKKISRLLQHNVISDVTDAEAALRAFDLTRLEGRDMHTETVASACMELAFCLSNLAGASMTLSDQLAGHYFSHVEDAGYATFSP